MSKQKNENLVLCCCIAMYGQPPHSVFGLVNKCKQKWQLVDFVLSQRYAIGTLDIYPIL